jgi:tetrapyrrole methylase family protein/MazG family protein
VGCPWDREQTLASLRKDLLSECVEVLEAIDLDTAGLDNPIHIAEELGDVLLLVTMMVQIAVDEGRFRMSNVVDQIVTKLIRRHPHVFGDVNVSGSEDVVVNWDAIKAQEKAEKGVLLESPFAGIPAELPALEKARELQSKAAKAGLLDRAALADSLPSLTSVFGLDISEDSIGEVLWVLAALAREHGIVAENALRRYAVTYRHKVEDSMVERDGDQSVDALS